MSGHLIEQFPARSQLSLSQPMASLPFTIWELNLEPHTGKSIVMLSPFIHSFIDSFISEIDSHYASHLVWN